MSIEELQQIFDLKEAYSGIVGCLIIMCVLLLAILGAIIFIAEYYFRNN